jgi:dihydroorotate dehydrogenase (NAD+) catalytic subunit
MGNEGTNVISVLGGGMLNSVGLKNPGTSVWVREHAPLLAECGTPVIVSVWGLTQQAVAAAAADVASCPQVSAIELNLSCPNIEDPRLVISHDPRRVRGYVSEVVAAVGSDRVPVVAKLAPSTPDLVGCARAAQDAGAEAVTLVNTLSGMGIDIDSRLPSLSGVFGGLSGLPLHPIALRAIFEVHSALPNLPIIGVGGVHDARSALELIAVGASAVQVGTACFADPRAPYKIAAGVNEWLKFNHLTPGELCGSVMAPTRPDEFGQLFQELMPAPAPPGGRPIPRVRSSPNLPRDSRRKGQRNVRERPPS